MNRMESKTYMHSLFTEGITVREGGQKGGLQFRCHGAVGAGCGCEEMSPLGVWESSLAEEEIAQPGGRGAGQSLGEDGADTG